MANILFRPRMSMCSAVTDDELKKYLGTVQQIYCRHGNDDDAAKGKLMTADLDATLHRTYSAPNIVSDLRKKARRAEELGCDLTLKK